MPVRTPNPQLASYIAAAYLNDFDGPILQSLVRNVGEEMAIELLELYRGTNLSGVMDRDQMKKSNGLYLIKEEYFDHILNLAILTNGIMIRCPNHQGAAKFMKEAQEYGIRYQKSSEEVVRSEKSGKVARIDETTIQNMKIALVFRACYFMAWIYKLPQRDLLVAEVNRRLVNETFAEFLAWKPQLNIPREIQCIERLNMMILSSFKKFLKKDLAITIETQAAIVQTKLLM